MFYFQLGAVLSLFTYYDLISLSSFSELGPHYFDSPVTLSFPLLAIFSLIIGVGVWRLRNWARQYTLAFLAVIAVMGFLLLVMGVSTSIGLFEMSMGIVGFWFFTRNSTREIYMGISSTISTSDKDTIRRATVTLQLCPQCNKKTAATLNYCTHCGFDTTVPSVRDRIIQLVTTAEKEYALKYKALYEFIKDIIDPDVFRAVYSDYITRISQVVQRIKDQSEDVIKESEKHNAQLTRYRKRARELRLRVAVQELPEETMESEIRAINLKLRGIYQRLNNLSESMEPLTKTFVLTLTEGRIYRLINDVISLTKAKEYEKMPKDIAEIIDKDIKKDNTIISYIEDIPQRLIIPDEIKICATCGDELDLGEDCLDCLEKVELKKTVSKRK
jgi:uncharacterized membrane protein YhaH (DUF805 family)